MYFQLSIRKFIGGRTQMVDKRIQCIICKRYYYYFKYKENICGTCKGSIIRYKNKVLELINSSNHGETKW